ncbi:3-hydroxyacyl-CoA dehydrogenase NAD-binding domain-containing protein [uncultured Roseobacter sp.]|uniref:3-hydroxyacyl-CoA dehydrogenase NAD-binding domain-containing protein n=1 Tax=uncultured Roseobacter sp. TaxID=114847 RepID=UPI002609121E|nr:3-hydroxyacyl-CoA dehydrogenase NAD-binding domain-containing protein [uncultured Roseobacter sp.]
MTVRYEKAGDVALLAADNPPVNALGLDMRYGLQDGMARALEDGARAVVIYGHGRTWFAGADIREFGKPPKDPMLPDLCNTIEASPVPVIAALHGTALGGGLEVAMACHYRICLGDAKLGLPEVGLGILPGAGGTQRLPRLVGFAKAIEMITTGKPIGAQDAHDTGLVDTLAAPGSDLRAAGLAYAEMLLASGAPPRPTRAIPAPEAVDFDYAQRQVAKKARGQLSPVTALAAVAAAATLSFDDGLAEERRLFNTLMETDQRKGLIHAFFAERQVSKLPELAGVAPRETDHIGVIGGGTMGAGIATAALLARRHVTVIERDSAAAEAGRKRIGTNLAGALRRGKIDQQTHDALRDDHLSTATDYVALAHSDVIIEAVFEDMAVKKQVFAQIEAVAKPGAVLATNTSYLDIDEIAASTSRAADVLGLHLFSPAHVMRLLEVVVGDATAPEVTATGFALGKALGKVSVRAGVCDGFIGNRILSAYRTAADHMILDGASPYQIDRVMEDFGFAMGPFAVADLAGLDIGWANRKRLAPTRQPHERVPAYVDRLCEEGHFGQKTGRGYYVYDDRNRSENPDVIPLIEAERAERGTPARDFTDAQILRRYMAAMVNEAAKVVGEGIARRPLDVDVVLLMGYGFPRYHGGPLKWADLQGLPDLLRDIETFAEEDPHFWQPAPLLNKLVAKGASFDDLNKDAQT